VIPPVLGVDADDDGDAQAAHGCPHPQRNGRTAQWISARLARVPLPASASESDDIMFTRRNISEVVALRSYIATMSERSDGTVELPARRRGPRPERRPTPKPETGEPVTERSGEEYGVGIEHYHGELLWKHCSLGLVVASRSGRLPGRLPVLVRATSPWPSAL
jgi:hypothetical protein